MFEYVFIAIATSGADDSKIDEEKCPLLPFHG